MASLKKSYYNISVIVALCFISALAPAQDTPDVRELPLRFAAPKINHLFREHKNEAFSVGERLVFDVNYGLVTAGEAYFEIPQLDTLYGRPCYRVTFVAQSAPALRWLYRVEDRFDTFIDMQGIFSWRFAQKIREGNYKNDFSADFDQANNVAYTTEGTHVIPPYVNDIVSAFFYVRTLDFTTLKPNDKLMFQNFYKDTSYDLGVRYLGKQHIKVQAGVFDCIMVEPLIKEGGLFKSEGRIVIWLTNDERKIPIRVRTKILIGSIDAELKEYRGVLEPLRGKVR
jgi:hypothetical protein